MARAVSGRAEVNATERWTFCEPVRGQAGLFEKLEDPGISSWRAGPMERSVTVYPLRGVHC
jgi:hypothetical protein